LPLVGFIMLVRYNDMIQASYFCPWPEKVCSAVWLGGELKAGAQMVPVVPWKGYKFVA